MSRTRIAFVTSRFWPISGVSQILAGELAVGFRDNGCEVEIITSRWEHRWNKSFTFRGIPVHRMPSSSSGPWGTFRTQRALAKQLNADWDAVVIFGIEDHFESTVRTMARSNTKILLRLDDSIPVTQLWPQNLSRRAQAAMEHVDCIVCTHTNTRDRLVAAGLDSTKIHVIPDGVPIGGGEMRTINQQSQSRLALSDAHPVLAIEPHEPLVVTGVPFNGDAGIYDLIESWKLVARRHPRSRLWVLGDGEQARQIWSHITKANLVYTAIMPGYFDSLDELFLAADIYVNPARDVTGHACLTRAMANGVCPISTDDVNGLIKDRINGLIVARQDPQQISTSLLSLIEDGNRRNQLSFAAMESATQCLPFERTLASYAQLIEQAPKSKSCESAT